VRSLEFSLPGCVIKGATNSADFRIKNRMAGLLFYTLYENVVIYLSCSHLTK
jgi:hypothetical protein